MISSISTINPDIKQVETIDTEGEFAASLRENHLIALTEDIVATAGRNRENDQIEIWDIETEKKISTLKAPEENVVGVVNSVEVLTFSADGRLLASGSQNSQIRLWHASTGKHLHTFQKRQEDMNDRNITLQLLFSPDNKYVVCGNEDTTVQVWDVTTGDSLAVFEAHIGQTTALAFSPDGKTMASIGGEGTILVWDWDEIRKSSPEKKDPLR